MPLQFIVVGNETLTLECLKLLHSRGHAVAFVVTESPEVRSWAEETGVAAGEHEPDALPPCDYLLSVANLRMLRPQLVAHPSVAAINFHDGPLPTFAGLNAPVWALLEGAAEFGVTWHLMTDGPDEGDILEQELFDVDPGETALSLNTRCFEAARTSFQRLLERLERRDVEGRPQDFSRRTYFEAKQRPAAAGVVDPASDFSAVDRLVRALDFGPYANPVGTAKLASAGGAIAVSSVRLVDPSVPGDTGTITSVGADSLTIQLSDGAAEFAGLRQLDGTPLAGEAALRALGLRAGERVGLTEVARTDAEAMACAAARFEGRWARLQANASPLELPLLRPTTTATGRRRVLGSFQPGADPTTALGAFLVGLSGGPMTLWSAGAQRVKVAAKAPQLFDAFVPVSFASDEPAPPTIEKVRGMPPMPRDMGARFGGRIAVTGDRVGVLVCEGAVGLAVDEQFDLLLRVDAATGEAAWDFREDRFDADDLAHLAEAFREFEAGCTGTSPARPELVASSQSGLFDRWNDTRVPLNGPGTVAAAFEAQALKTPDRPAVTGGGRSLTYRELNERANRLAHRLIALGASADSLVAVHMGRSVDLVVALLAIHKAGGAYVPIDPEYPEARKQLMLEDSRARLVLVDQSHRLAPGDGVTEVRADEDDDVVSSANPAPRSTAENLAYVIYTSGSTGRPKGVMVEHGNVINFFRGMDDRLGTDPGTWLAVTSISFDISVLELLWTLTRGFTVVLSGVRKAVEAAKPSLSVSFFASEAGTGANPYGLLLEAAKRADAQGFEAAWMPERHFHAFGGAFPNPAVTAAAVAATTQRLKIRAGSCVLPLHSPARVAEEWAMVDQLSGGRVGISFAAGWQPRDFVLNPAAFGGGKERLERDIRTVEALWKGESVTFPGHDGAAAEISTLPRPVQKELPTWLTSAGDPETFRMAGRLGYNILTHLLGQSVEELAAKIGIYRQARAEAGFKGAGHVTLMLHTFINDDNERAKDIVREPLIGYLASSVGLIKNFAASFPAFKRLPEGEEANDLLASLSAEEMRDLLEIAFERYYETSGLFGDAERANEMLERVGSVGVDEVACLIDFGIDDENVLASLDRLAALRQTPDANAPSVAELIGSHQVTHLQCTPSMAGMLVADDETRTALATLKTMMVGGEAFPEDLAQRLREVLQGRLLNMYGPTETTIWSTTSEILRGDSGVTIGSPIANTAIHILNKQNRRMPLGCVGELWIGGLGVTRGYFGREDLTAERFVADPFANEPNARMYRTGDLARWRADGSIDFLGRVDQQVKVRGYRIEPGEIESVVRGVPGVGDAVVIAREDDPGDQRLVCYYVAAGAEDPGERGLRDVCSSRLPAHMVPTNFVMLDALPLTPNKKVDRKALPRPGTAVAEARTPAAIPAATATGTAAPEAISLVQQTWIDVLKTAEVDLDRTFFDCGGNSLLLLQVHRRLSAVRPGLRLTDLFKYPTVNALAAHLSDNGDSTNVTDDASNRARARRAAVGRRPVQV